MKITLFSKKPILSGANYLCKGLKQLGHEVTFCCMSADDEYSYNTESLTTDTEAIREAIDSCDMLILSASVTLDWIYKMFFNGLAILEEKQTKIVIGDSNYCRDASYYNELFKQHNIQVHMMPDISHYCTVPHNLYYPPCKQFEHIAEEKDDFIVSHLPGIKYDSGIKGTKDILEIMGTFSQKDSVEFVCKGVTPWKEVIDIKKQSSLYIDQIIDEKRYGHTYKGGLGKNGIEAMMLGTPVITSGKAIKDVPMFWVTKDNLKDTIELFKDNPTLLNKYRIQQKRWVVENCTPEAVARKLLKED